VVAARRRLADAHGASTAQVAPALGDSALGRGLDDPRYAHLEQLDDNLGAARLELEPEQLARLDGASDAGHPAYPYGVIEETSRDRVELRG
jgi:aryl-alcohol dehydrogenase-like predicted oxidoreductase